MGILDFIGLYRINNWWALQDSNLRLPFGWRRTSNAGLLTAAFEDLTQSSLIVLNRSTTPQQLKVEWTGKHWKQMERTGQTLENAASTTVPSKVVVQPGEIVTLSNFVAN